MSGLFSRIKGFLRISSEQNSTTTSHAGDIEITLPASIDAIEINEQFYEAIFGHRSSEESLSVPHKLVVEVVSKNLANKLKRIKAVPRLPTIIPKLMQSLRDPDASAKDYVQIINKDPAMSTAVLKLANSAYFNPQHKRITSIEFAVVKLGIEGLRSVLSAAVMQPVIQRKSNYFSQFGHKLWDHSLNCAVACEIIARKRGLEPFKAYLLGLIHDVGKITLYSELSSQYSLNTADIPPGYAAFVPLMKVMSPTLSHWIACDWEMPDDICAALEHQIDIDSGEQVGPYAQLLFHANLACEAYAIINSSEEPDPRLEQLLEDMALPTDLFEQLTALSTQVSQ